jgi:hypothetical protein
MESESWGHIVITLALQVNLSAFQIASFQISSAHRRLALTSTNLPDILADLAQNDFLMHAIFLVSATHLQELQPSKTGDRVVALEHLSQVLPTFRSAIETIPHHEDCSMDTAEALIACALLLIQYSWTFESQTWSSLLGLYRGLKDVTFALLSKIQGGWLSPILGCCPKLRIEHYMTITEETFHPKPDLTHCLTCTKISDIQPENPSDFSDPIQRLMEILWALDLDCSRPERHDLKLDAARYLFSVPGWLSDGFIRLIRLEDGRAQVFMLYYFAAISRLKSETFWWMRKRANYMFEAISLSLGNRCEECTRPGKEIFRYEALF